MKDAQIEEPQIAINKMRKLYLESLPEPPDMYTLGTIAPSVRSEKYERAKHVIASRFDLPEIFAEGDFRKDTEMGAGGARLPGGNVAPAGLREMSDPIARAVAWEMFFDFQEDLLQEIRSGVTVEPTSTRKECDGHTQRYLMALAEVDSHDEILEISRWLQNEKNVDYWNVVAEDLAARLGADFLMIDASIEFVFEQEEEDEERFAEFKADALRLAPDGEVGTLHSLLERAFDWERFFECTGVREQWLEETGGLGEL